MNVTVYVNVEVNDYYVVSTCSGKFYSLAG